MEQKQLDEIDESYFGEEFIDDEEIKIERLEPDKKTKKAKTTKKSPQKEIKKEPEVEITELKQEVPEPEEIIPPVENKEPIATSEPIDPWSTNDDDPWKDEEDAGLFKEASTWKALTGIAVILLVLSLFTQGFHFSESPTTAAVSSLSLTEAEQKTLDFVNSNLLEPPFEAELVSSKELAGVFKVTLSLAGQTIDSYLTKDGEVFFPQGFPVNEQLENSQVKLEENPVVEEPVEEVASETSLEEVEETPTEQPVVEEPVVEETPEPVVETVKHTATYKKWTFSPQKLSVKKGSHVVLTLSPDTSNPDFALGSFTFSIPELGVEKEVSGETTIEFDTPKTGSFGFKCSSCTGTPAAVMVGEVVVE